jgi:hypothetical protein
LTRAISVDDEDASGPSEDASGPSEGGVSPDFQELRNNVNDLVAKTETFLGNGYTIGNLLKWSKTELKKNFLEEMIREINEIHAACAIALQAANAGTGIANFNP